MTRHNGQESFCDWRTPEWILQRCRAVIGGDIDLDPASAPDNPTRARRFYTEGGLERPWDGSSLFLNPPWSRRPGVAPIKWWAVLWADYVTEHPESDAFLIVPASVNARWFHDWVFPFAASLAFPEGRVVYVSPGGEEAGHKGTTFDTAIAYAGPHAWALFYAMFSDRCKVL